MDRCVSFRFTYRALRCECLYIRFDVALACSIGTGVNLIFFNPTPVERRFISIYQGRPYSPSNDVHQI